jgi:hypothetical protein
MPRRELKFPSQIVAWLEDWGNRLSAPGTMTLIGSGGLLWHAARMGKEDPLPENSMDVDPITDNEEIASLGYEAMIGSEFEKQRGWHVNLMPRAALSGLPAGWESRASRTAYGRLTVIVPAAADLLVPKLARGEARDLKHAEYAQRLNMVGRIPLPPAAPSPPQKQEEQNEHRR